MHKNLETYLEEISHFLSGREEREEILAEIRSHILEKAEQEAGRGRRSRAGQRSSPPTARRAGWPKNTWTAGRSSPRPCSATCSATRRCFFAVHLVFILFAVIFKESFIVFPLLFVPRLGVIGAIFYLPMAFLADFGVVALVLYFITRSGREIKLPWPKFAVDLDEVKAADGEDGGRQDVDPGRGRDHAGPDRPGRQPLPQVPDHFLCQHQLQEIPAAAAPGTQPPASP